MSKVLYQFMPNNNMKNLKILTIITILNLILLSACEDDATKSDDKPLVGKFTWNEWQQKAGWHNYDAPNYIPNEKICKELADSIQTNQYDFIIFTSSWCPDCMVQMPRIMKLLDKIGIDKNLCSIYGLDYKKTEPTGIYLTYEIKRVPTLIILKNNDEIGRIVEEVNESWEKDILKQITK